MTKYYISILIILTNILCRLNINCKKEQIYKKKRKHKANKAYKAYNTFISNKNTKNADSVRPTDISRELFCDVCQAIIVEALKNLRNLYKESDVISYLTNEICLQKNFNNYHFSKPEMEIGCEVFLGEYYDDIQKLLIERNPKSDTKEKLINNFCYDKIKACNGVDLTNIKPIESEIINGELYDIENVEKTYRVYPKIEEDNYGEDDFKKNMNSQL